MDDCFTLPELYAMNDYSFGFRFTNWRPRHFIVEAIDFGAYFQNGRDRVWVSAPLSGASNGTHRRLVFLGNVYDLSTGEFTGRQMEIPNYDQRFWLPA